VFDPPALVAFRLTVNVPVLAYVWTGFRTVALTRDPSPNVQFHEVGVLVELSVNITVNGTVPDVGTPVNDATGATTDALTLMNVTWVEMLYPPALVAFRAIEKLPTPNVWVGF
jgi:hypothetical protein